MTQATIYKWSWSELENLIEIINGCFPGGGGSTPYNGLYGEGPPERGAFFKLAVY